MKAGLTKVFAWMGIVIGLVVNLAVAQEGYPHREKYPDVKVISTEELMKQYGDVMIVDVRSSMEYDVVRIKKAVHVPVSSKYFERDLKKQIVKYEKAQKRRRKPKARSAGNKKGENNIIFYCNGHSCEKSYKASRKAMESGFDNVFCYDSGIFDWVQANPKQSLLMGRRPSARNKVIPKDEYQAHLISLQEFEAKAAESDAIVIDIRDAFQRANAPGPKVEGIVNAPIDNLIKLIKSKEHQNKQLLLFDAVGKQVRWVHYYLKQYGYTDFKFLKGGVGHKS